MRKASTFRKSPDHLLMGLHSEPHWALSFPKPPEFAVVDTKISDNIDKQTMYQWRMQNERRILRLWQGCVAEMLSYERNQFANNALVRILCRRFCRLFWIPGIFSTSPFSWSSASSWPTPSLLQLYTVHAICRAAGDELKDQVQSVRESFSRQQRQVRRVQSVICSAFIVLFLYQ